MSIETTTENHRTIGVTPSAPWRIKAVTVLPDYRLSVTSNDDTSGIVDMSLLVKSERAGMYSELKDEQLFSRVCLELGVLTWPNGADLDPEWVHDEVSGNKSWSVTV